MFSIFSTYGQTNKPTDEPTNKLFNEPTNEPTNNRPTYGWTGRQTYPKNLRDRSFKIPTLDVHTLFGEICCQLVEEFLNKI